MVNEYMSSYLTMHKDLPYAILCDLVAFEVEEQMMYDGEKSDTVVF